MVYLLLKPCHNVVGKNRPGDGRGSRGHRLHSFATCSSPTHVRRLLLRSFPRPQAAFCPNVNAATKEQKPFSRSAAK